MIWGAFSEHGVLSLAILEGIQTAIKYIETLSNYLLPFSAKMFNSNWVYQRDNASIRRVKITKDWFVEMNIDVMEWPARSPDLHSI